MQPKRTNKFLNILLTLVMALTLLPAFTLAAYAAEPVNAGTLAELQAAAAAVPDGQAASITITRRIEMNEHVTLDGTGKNITILRGVTGDLFTVGAGGSLTLENIIIDGNNTVEPFSTNSDGSLVRVNGGTLTMNGGAVLRNNIAGIAEAGSGAGVDLHNGTFTLSGGIISGNIGGAHTIGGGIYMLNSTFTMYGGEIKENVAGQGGGIFMAGSNTFTMTGGAINNNTAYGNLGGGGVTVAGSGTFTMTGGTINNNTASHANGMAGGIQVRDAASSFIMTGGEIRNNTAGDDGGGVRVNGTLVLGGRAIITGNTRNGVTNNVHLLTNRFIILGTDYNAPVGMSAGVTKVGNDDVFVQSGATAAKAAFFTADNSLLRATHNNGQLVLEAAPGPVSRSLTNCNAAGGTLWSFGVGDVWVVEKL